MVKQRRKTYTSKIPIHGHCMVTRGKKITNVFMPLSLALKSARCRDVWAKRGICKSVVDLLATELQSYSPTRRERVPANDLHESIFLSIYEVLLY